MNKWISVKDGLPEDDDKYLCYYHFKGSGRYYYGVLAWLGAEEVPHFQFEGLQNMAVTHWMKLPEAPIDPESLRERGQWIMQQDNTGVCSNCHRQDHIDPLVKYCRYCGARMDGVTEAKHGKWIMHDDEILGLDCECSRCHILTFGDSPYCPHCGARMDEEDEND